MVVNFCEDGLFKLEHADPVVLCTVAVVPDPAARCCQMKAPTTRIINTTGIPILIKRRVRVFIIDSFLKIFFYGGICLFITSRRKKMMLNIFVFWLALSS